MKRFLSFCLALIFCLQLVACGYTEKLALIDEKILAIGEVTLEDEAIITEIETEIAGLTEGEKGKLKNYEVLVIAKKGITALLEEKEEQERILKEEFTEAYNKLLLTIGTIKLKSDEWYRYVRTVNEAAWDMYLEGGLSPEALGEMLVHEPYSALKPSGNLYYLDEDAISNTIESVIWKLDFVSGRYLDEIAYMDFCEYCLIPLQSLWDWMQDATDNQIGIANELAKLNSRYGEYFSEEIDLLYDFWFEVRSYIEYLKGYRYTTGLRWSNERQRYEAYDATKVHEYNSKMHAAFTRVNIYNLDVEIDTGL